MISEKITMKSCVGKYATLDRDIKNGAGAGMGKGCRVKIIGSNNYGMTIRSEKCSCCQQFSEISRVQRRDLTLMEVRHLPGKDNNVTANDGWIPAEERLPEDNKDSDYYESVIVTLLDGRVTPGVYRNYDKEWLVEAEDGAVNYSYGEEVIAWQPLPEPYRARKNGEEHGRS